MKECLKPNFKKILSLANIKSQSSLAVVNDSNEVQAKLIITSLGKATSLTLGFDGGYYEVGDGRTKKIGRE